MTSRNTRETAVRSPEFQQLPGDAVGTPLLPVQRTAPGRRVPRVPTSTRRVSLPVRRATYDGWVQNSDRTLTGAEPPHQTAGRLFRLTARGARPRGRRGVTGSHRDLVWTRDGCRRAHRRYWRSVFIWPWGTATTSPPPQRPHPSPSGGPLPSARRSTFRRNAGLPTKAVRSRAHPPAQAVGMRSRRTRILRSFGSRPVAVAGTWPASSQSALGSVAAHFGGRQHLPAG